jgi:hypothetical protein
MIGPAEIDLNNDEHRDALRAYGRRHREMEERYFSYLIDEQPNPTSTAQLESELYLHCRNDLELDNVVKIRDGESYIIAYLVRKDTEYIMNGHTCVHLTFRDISPMTGNDLYCFVIDPSGIVQQVEYNPYPLEH